MQRALLHLMPNVVRVLVEFTGMAGAYRGVRALDQYVFGLGSRGHLLHGQVLRAHYYPSALFQEGTYGA